MVVMSTIREDFTFERNWANPDDKISPKTRLSRLQKLHYLLINHVGIFEGLKFNMYYWVKTKEIKNDCKTAACALGSAALYKPFNKLGLKIQFNPERGIFEPIFKRYTGFEAGEVFFGITKGEAESLFDPMAYGETAITRRMVAKRVKDLIVHYKTGKGK